MQLFQHAGENFRWRFVAALALLWLSSAPSSLVAQAPQITPEEKAGQLIESAHRAYNEQQYPQAIERYRQYLKEFGGGKDVQSARYGLGLALVEHLPRDFKGAIEALTPLAADAAFPDRAYALYYLGASHRGVGLDFTYQAVARPAEGPQLMNSARDQFTQAATRFGECSAAFVARAKAAPPAVAVVNPQATAPPDALSPDAEWAVRTRCDQAEMLLRVEKPLEAKALTEAFTVASGLTKSRYYKTGLYLHGQACFLLKDYLAAGRALIPLAPFDDPVFGTHAQYLLARTHHLANERAEALALYEGVAKAWEAQKVQLQQQLQNPVLQKQPEEKARLEFMLKSPPDYASRTMFYHALLLYETQKFADAQARFVEFPKLYPQSPLVPEALLRQGMSEVQLRQYQPAVTTLQPLLGHATLADRALLYSARAVLAQADPKQPPQVQQAAATAIERLRQAADRANQLIAQEPEAKLRRAECQLELGDAQQVAKDFAGAAATYGLALQENHDPERTEELLQRLATSLHLAGQFDPADQICQRYVQAYPRGALLAAVLFRYAENAFAKANAIEPGKPVAANSPAVAAYTEALKRYQTVVEKFPEAPQLAMARYHAAIAHYRLGAYDKALAELAAIDGPDRQGEIAAASYYQADILMRGISFDATDALAAGRQVQTLGECVKLLETFIPVDPLHPLVADALLKLAVCQTQLAVLAADPNERNNQLNVARQTFEKSLQNTPQFAAVMPRATFERAKCMLAQGDVNGAINEFSRFRTDPLRNADVAPLAVLRLASLLTSQNRVPEAVTVLAEARAHHENTLMNDPARAGWALLLQYHHGLALKQTAKPTEARALFENAVQRFAATRVEAYEAAWRAGQCRREEIWPKVEAARKKLAEATANPAEHVAAWQQLTEAVKPLAEAGAYVRDQATQLEAKAKGTDVHQRLLHEAAWCFRAAAEIEIDLARKKLTDEATAKLQAELVQRFPAPAKSPNVRTVETPLTAVPAQPSETESRRLFAAAVAAKSDAPLAIAARTDLAELHVLRGENDPALVLLQEALDAEPPPELEERVRMNFGAALLAKGDAKNALSHFGIVAANEKSPHLPEARYRQGECFIVEKDWAKAAERFAGFRDLGPLQNIPGLSDRALLRLGFVLAQAQQWEPSRQAYEVLLNRFAQSGWRFEARYGFAYALDQQKNFDGAVQQYQQLANETASEPAARGLYRAGACRAEQKRPAEALAAYLAVSDTYDYPHYTGPALLEAAKLQVELQKPEEAAKLLDRVVRELPNTEWATAAAKNRAAIVLPAAK